MWGEGPPQEIKTAGKFCTPPWIPARKFLRTSGTHIDSFLNLFLVAELRNLLGLNWALIADWLLLFSLLFRTVLHLYPSFLSFSLTSSCSWIISLK